MELQQYYDLLADHDWYYAFSDSNSIFKRGANSYNSLVELSKLSSEHLDLFTKFKLWVQKSKNNKKPDRPGGPKKKLNDIGF